MPPRGSASPRLPWRSAWAVATALGVYREIGKRVRAAEDPWAERQSVPTWRKLWHVAGASTAPLRYRALRGTRRARDSGRGRSRPARSRPTR